MTSATGISNRRAVDAVQNGVLRTGYTRRASGEWLRGAGLARGEGGFGRAASAATARSKDFKRWVALLLGTEANSEAGERRRLPGRL